MRERNHSSLELLDGCFANSAPAGRELQAASQQASRRSPGPSRAPFAAYGARHGGGRKSSARRFTRTIYSREQLIIFIFPPIDPLESGLQG
ncbi:hypothetical protein ACVWXO_000849 [Bradyrhizobium sp. LM2.7]